jgi:hypothetical protein|tara:strand:- start:2135 stop:2566 length:432 start_codon:yes stop_codon:yes gene_type:complete
MSLSNNIIFKLKTSFNLEKILKPEPLKSVIIYFEEKLNYNEPFLISDISDLLVFENLNDIGRYSFEKNIEFVECLFNTKTRLVIRHPKSTFSKLLVEYTLISKKYEIYAFDESSYTITNDFDNGFLTLTKDYLESNGYIPHIT